MQSCHCLCRYEIQYTVSDADYIAARPVTISITFAEVAVVTGSFLLIAQASSTDLAQQYAEQLNTTASASNSALTSAVATVYHTWLAAATSSYVGQLTSSLGASAATDAASNTLQLGQFSSVGVPDVTILGAAIDQNVTAALNTNSSDVTQNYAYNVTLQVAVLTSDMLLSVFVDVLNSTGSSRRLLSTPSLIDADMWTPPQLLHTQALSSPEPALDSLVSGQSHAVAHVQQLAHGRLQYDADSTLDSAGSTGTKSQADAWAGAAQIVSQDSSSVGVTAPCYSTIADAIIAAQQSQHAVPAVAQHTDTHLKHKLLAPAPRLPAAPEPHPSRHLLQTNSSSATFPLASLLQFKMDLVLAAFLGTSGCSTDSLTDLFYQDQDPPDDLPALCAADSSAAGYSLNRALQAAANRTVPLLQVQCVCLILLTCNHDDLFAPRKHIKRKIVPQDSTAMLYVPSCA